MTTLFKNARELNLAHPETFEIPPDTLLRELKAGWYVKVNCSGERFWVKITRLDFVEKNIWGTVDNVLILTDIHGLSYGDEVCFTRENIYDIRY